MHGQSLKENFFPGLKAVDGSKIRDTAIFQYNVVRILCTRWFKRVLARIIAKLPQRATQRENNT